MKMDDLIKIFQLHSSCQINVSRSTSCIIVFTMKMIACTARVFNLSGIASSTRKLKKIWYMTWPPRGRDRSYRYIACCMAEASIHPTWYLVYLRGTMETCRNIKSNWSSALSTPIDLNQDEISFRKFTLPFSPLLWIFAFTGYLKNPDNGKSSRSEDYSTPTESREGERLKLTNDTLYTVSPMNQIEILIVHLLLVSTYID